MFSRQEEVYGIQGVACNGTEYMLRQCQNSTIISDECLNGSHVAGVRCVESKLVLKIILQPYNAAYYYSVQCMIVWYSSDTNTTYLLQ